MGEIDHNAYDQKDFSLQRKKNVKPFPPFAVKENIYFWAENTHNCWTDTKIIINILPKCDKASPAEMPEAQSYRSKGRTYDSGTAEHLTVTHGFPFAREARSQLSGSHAVRIRKPMQPKSLLNSVLLALSLGACVAANADATAWTARQNTLAPYKGAFNEFCVTAEKNQHLMIEVRTPHPIDFNVHFHAPKKTLFPVKERVVAHAEYDVLAGRSGEYCLMWTNAQKLKDSFTIDTRYRVE